MHLLNLFKRTQLSTLVTLGGLLLAFSPTPVSLAGFAAIRAPAVARPPTGIRSWNFDWDDNVMFMPSRIYIYSRKTGLEKSLSTGEFAKLNSVIGKSGKYKNFEIHPDSDPKPSFREFRDIPGRNVFLEQVETALKLPVEQWKGPSFNSFVEALNDPESANWTSIITARGHSPSEIFEALQLLKKKGLIKCLPLVKNIYAVGSARMKLKYGQNTAATKLEIMKGELDRLQVRPVPHLAGKMTDAAGTGTRASHQWGFSDDDYTNFKTAMDGLSTDVKQGRWPDVKIALFYTGPVRKDVSDRAWILSTEGARPMIQGEQQQLVDRKSKVSEVMGEEIAPLHEVLAPGVKPSGNVKALPPSVVVSSDLPTAQAGLGQMYVSHPYAVKSRFAKAGVDLNAEEVGAINRFIDDDSIPSRDKEIILTRYEVGDPGAIDALIRAKKAGIRTTLITDFNVSLKYEFAEGEKFSIAFKKASFNTTPMAEGLQKLYAAGFKLNDPDFGIFSQPLYPTDSMAPIMHEKSLLALVKGKPVTYYQGTSNLTDNPRYNRLFKVTDPQTSQAALNHAEELKRNFAAGGEIKDIRTEAPLRIIYRDGSFVEHACTDGRYNPNQRVADLLTLAATQPEKLKIQEVVMSEFVLTNRNVVDALQAAMTAQQEFRVFGVFDQKFIDTFGYGMAPALEGLDVFRPMGPPVKGYPTVLKKRMDIFGYQRGVDGRVETKLEGPPNARHLWHDKTMMVRVLENGEDWTYIFTGSLNNSNHVTNAETQAMYRVPSSSPLAQDTRASIVEVSQAESTFSIPLEKAEVRLLMAELTGHRDLEVPIENVEEVLASLRSGNLSTMRGGIHSIAELPTTLDHPVDLAAVDAKVAKLVDFMTWYKTQPAFGTRGIRTTDFFRISALIMREDLRAGTQASILNAVLWHPDIPKAQLNRDIAKAATLLEIEDPLTALGPGAVQAAHCRKFLKAPAPVGIEVAK